MEVLTDRATGRIVASGRNLSQPDDPALTLADLDPSQEATLLQDGIHTLSADGTVVVEPDQAALDAEAARQAAVAAQVATVEQSRAAQSAAAQVLIEAATDQTQADALRAFIRTMGVEV